MTSWVDYLAAVTIPSFLAFIPLYGLCKRVDVFASFIEGATEGLTLAARTIPYVVAIFVAIGIFRASGALDILAGLLRPALDPLGLPGEILPLAIVRPLSGSGSFALMAELLERFGPDSYIGRLASTMQASTDTTFYVLSLYFGSVGILSTRHAVPVGLTADIAGFVASALAVKLFFGY